jgi:hypothetical protein
VTDIEAGDTGASYEAPVESDAAYTTVHKQAVDGGPGDDGLSDDGRYAMAQASE